MTKMSREQMQADWIATKRIAALQAQLDAETDVGESSILTRLIADEFATLRKPQSGVIESDRVTVDVGNPIMGFVFGALLVAGTTGGFFLWENYRGGADARAAVVTVQSR